MSQKVTLDVRKDLENNQDPFKKIMSTVKNLNDDEIFVLHSTIKPTPLLGVMKAKGFDNEVEKLGEKHYQTTFQKRKNGLFSSFFKKKKREVAPTNNSPLNQEELTATFLDNRGLEPPQPMVRTIKRLEMLEPNETLTIHNDRVPVYLIEELKDMGIRYSIEEQPDGSAKVHLTRE
ncbi:DUF2249 domain-containing protein [Bacillus shivajii]|uniref:DUF2249 domain-containing protein n=1 Tax=Bacillus shivajii TaxID=1983719 RepID=UPI001CFC323E|nr:DUF2249 domain-containing protein [Bacillus shivajii]UCZ52444.1 DUF2249 domain-containing protein [Bacillus shivajii]